MFDNIENCNSEILDVVIGCMLPNFDFQIDILEYLQFQLLSVSEPNIGRIFNGFLALYEQLRDPGNLSLVTYVSIKRQMAIRGKVGKSQMTSGRKAAKNRSVANKNRKMRSISHTVDDA